MKTLTTLQPTPTISYFTLRAAMRWWNSLALAEHDRLKKANPCQLRSAGEIARFWLANNQPGPVAAPIPDCVRMMIQVPGFYRVSDTDHPEEYAVVEVTDTGVVHQVSPDNQRDGELSNHGWRSNATVDGPFLSARWAKVNKME